MQRKIESTKIVTTLDNLVLNDPVQIGRYTIFAITNPHASAIDMMASKTAYEQKLLTIREVNQNGVVNELIAESGAEIPILISEGEELIGAKQNRIVNVSVLLASKSKCTIPVNCTEAGRWHSRGDDIFNRETYKADRQVRAEILEEFGQKYFEHKKNGKQVSNANRSSENLDYSNLSRKTQGHAWKKIANRLQETGYENHSSKLFGIYEGMEDIREGLVNEVALESNQMGLIVFSEGLPTLLEYVGNPSCYAHLHQAVARSLFSVELLYSMRLAEFDEKNEITVAKGEALKWIKKMKDVKFESSKGVSLGTNLFGGNATITGSAIEFEDEIAYMAMHNSNARPFRKRNQ